MASLDESDELASLKAEIDRLRSELDENRALVQSLGLEGERAKGILEVAADGILTIDESGLIEYVNPAISHIFGFDADELIGQNVRLLMPAPHEKAHDGYLENYRRTRERKILGVGREVTARHRDGTSFPIELAVS